MGIIVTVTNITMENVQQKMELKIDDEVKDSQDINLLPGESQEITFITSGGKAGSYQVSINGVTGTFNVMAANSARYLH